MTLILKGVVTYIPKETFATGNIIYATSRATEKFCSH